MGLLGTSRRSGGQMGQRRERGHHERRRQLHGLLLLRLLSLWRAAATRRQERRKVGQPVLSEPGCGCGRSLLLLVLKDRVVLRELGELGLVTLVGVALAGRCGRR